MNLCPSCSSGFKNGDRVSTPGLIRRQPVSIPPENNNLCKVGVGKGQTLINEKNECHSLHFPGKFSPSNVDPGSVWYLS